MIALWLSNFLRGPLGTALLWLLAGIVTVLLAIVFAMSLRLATAKMKTAQCEKAAIELHAEAQRFALEVAERERARDAAHRLKLQEIEHAFLTQMEASHARSDALESQLRAGTVRVRREVCDARSSGVSGAARTSAGSDGGAKVRVHPAVAAVGVGGEADTRVKALQSIVRAQVARCNVH